MVCMGSCSSTIPINLQAKITISWSESEYIHLKQASALCYSKGLKAVATGKDLCNGLLYSN